MLMFLHSRLRNPIEYRTVKTQHFFLIFLPLNSYTFFYILYPVGAGSEAIEIYQSLPFAHTIHPAYYYFLVAMICIYPPGNVSSFHLDALIV